MQTETISDSKQSSKPPEADQLPPHDEGIEWFLVACCVYRPNLVRTVSVEHFYAQGPKAIYKRLRKLEDAGRAEASPEFVVRFQMLLPTGHQVTLRLNQALMELPTAEGWNYWLQRADELRQARALQQVVCGIEEDIAAIRHTGQPIELHRHSETLRNVQVGLAESENARSVVGQVIDRMETSMTNPDSTSGISTGIAGLDYRSTMRPGALWIVAARPSVGKSALAINVMLTAARAGKRVLMLSAEMTPQQIGTRLLSIASRVPLEIIRNPAGCLTELDQARIAEATVELSKLPFDLRMAADLNSVSAAVVTHAQRGVDLVLVDYLQKIAIPGSKDPRHLQVGQVSGTLKSLALGHMIPVIACAQLGRAYEAENRAPRLSDLRESGSIEQDADVVLFLHQQESEDTTSPIRTITGIVGKNRDGDVGPVSLAFEPRTTAFWQLERQG